MPEATRAAFGSTLLELAEAFPNLVVLDADLSKSTMTAAFAEKYPSRHFEFGIAESNMIGAAAGLALSGKIPVAASFACFLVGRLETIRVAVILNRANVKLVGTHAGLGIGEDGASQMGLEDIAALRGLPRIAILQPGDALEARQAVAWMLKHEGPVYLRLTRQKLEDIHKPDYKFEFGKADLVWQPEPKPRHFQATIFASGGTVGGAIAAAKELLPRGFSARVFNAATIKPFDEQAVDQAAAVSERLVTVEDHNVSGGLGAAVCEAAASLGLKVPVVALGTRELGESGSPAELYERHGLSAPRIAEACLRNLSSC
ncbi:MAG: transketolase C-terminal domain-containing protein [Elusimicrobia bacterium]|nr:transketolase C-terminal domain-containing protein [Elusimicrobiota bacterium]